jgi:hypothetical protein
VTGHPARLLLVLAAFLSLAPAVRAEAPPATDGWIDFEANWSAAGRERVLAMGDRTAATFDLAGPFVVTRGDGLSRGFFAQALGFLSTGAIGIGRLVLTDDLGDEIFIDLRGQGLGTGKHIEGAITGGSGRYAHVEGGFVFDWQYVIRGDDGAIQGRAVGLTGRYRRLPAATPGAAR